MIAAILPIVGKLLDKVIPDPAERDRAKAALLDMQQAGELKELETAAQIITAEAQAGGLAAQWRPITMLIFAGIVANNYLLAPYLNAMFGWSAATPMPDQLWTLLNVGIGGYVFGRSAEKFAKEWQAKK